MGPEGARCQEAGAPRGEHAWVHVCMCHTSLERSTCVTAVPAVPRPHPTLCTAQRYSDSCSACAKHTVEAGARGLGERLGLVRGLHPVGRRCLCICRELTPHAMHCGDLMSGALPHRHLHATGSAGRVRPCACSRPHSVPECLRSCPAYAHTHAQVCI